jgi:NO-binding membrane sensor protein with MHYT domain/GGDEF domain-containing protein
MPISATTVHLHGAHTSTDTALMLLIAFMLSYAILDAACRVRSAHGHRRTLWVVGGSLVIGLGIFAFHFIALLSVELPLPMTADPVVFGVSAVTAVIAAAGALHHVNKGVSGLPPLAVGAGLKGFALVATHYTSVAALHVPATIDYKPQYIAASVVIAIAVSAAGLALAERLRSETPGRAVLERAIGALTMAGGLLVLHQVSADAGQFVPDDIWVAHATHGHHLHQLPEAWLLPWVAGAGAVAVTVLGVAATLSRHAHWRRSTRPTTELLTGLPNGALLRDHLAAALAEDRPPALIAVRVQHVEALRRGLGRRDAERVLMRIGQRLCAAARPSDLVACLGQGEFAVVVADHRPEVGREVGERVAKRLATPVKLGALEIVVETLIGATTARVREEPRDVLQRAQLAAHRSTARPALTLLHGGLAEQPAVAVAWDTGRQINAA